MNDRNAGDPVIKMLDLIATRTEEIAKRLDENTSG